jgi:succinylglutamate desuccinylase
VIAARSGTRPGTTVLVVGGIHGNEPAGLIAGKRVATLLERAQIELRGELVVMTGNRPALAGNCRYLDRDMNRRWSQEHLARTQARHAHEQSREDREQLELAQIFEQVVEDTAGDVLYLDLHSTSGEAHPFAVAIENESNLAIADALSVPVIVDLDAFIESPSMTWWVERGLPALGIEGGVHDGAETVDHLERTIWESLVAVGCIDAIPSGVTVGRCDEGDGESRTFRVQYRQAVIPGSGFAMAPGFPSFRKVVEGEVVANNRTGAVRSPMSGYIFLPRYQDQGEDGFFLLTADADA